MKFTIANHSSDAVVAKTAWQASRVFEEAVASAAAPGAPFQNVGAIHILLAVYAIKGLAGNPERKSRGSYNRKYDGYYIWSNVDFDAFVRDGWNSRIRALADAGRRGVAAIAKTRVTPEERELLVKWIAEAEIAALRCEPAELEAFNEEARKGFPDTVMAQEPQPARHVRLYKSVDGVRHYREMWFRDGQSVEHAGVVGETGNSASKPVAGDQEGYKELKQFETVARLAGFRPVSQSRQARLIVEYASAAIPAGLNVAAVEKLHDTLDEILGWRGLGYCDGGSSGPGTAELCCFVVDFKLAKAVLERELPLAGFPLSFRIYHET